MKKLKEKFLTCFCLPLLCTHRSSEYICVYVYRVYRMCAVYRIFLSLETLVNLFVFIKNTSTHTWRKRESGGRVRGGKKNFFTFLFIFDVEKEEESRRKREKEKERAVGK